jgi:transcriptional regulator with XRE-family HTH domain
MQKCKIKENLASLLKRKRLELQLTQQDIAKIIQCDHSLVSRYETGTYEPSGMILIKLLKALKINIEELPDA